MKIENSYHSGYSDSFRNKTLEQYKNDYLGLVDYYKNLNEDNDEINFIISEIRLITEYIKPVVQNEKTELEQKGTYDLTNEMIKKRLSSYNKIILFLETKKTDLNNNNQIAMKNEDTLNWKGSDLQFSELTKALFETKLISPELTQKEFFKRMKMLFSIEDFEEKEKLKIIRARIKDLTPFIDILETSLNNWIKNKD